MSTNFRPSAYPLITIDPYISIWADSERLDSNFAKHWTGRPAPIFMSVSNGKEEYILAGCNRFHNVFIGSKQKMAHSSVSVSPLSTTYVFENDSVKATVTFTTPLLLDKLDILCRPVSYVAYELESKTEEKFEFHFGISSEICVNDYDKKVKFGKTDVSCFCGNAEQNVLSFSGDPVLIDWGYLHLADKNCYVMQNTARSKDVLDYDKEYTPYTDVVYLACTRKEEKGVITVGYDEVYPIQYFCTKLDEAYKKQFSSFEEMLADSDARYEEIKALCDKFDMELTEEAGKLGEDYKNIVTLAYRQAIAAHKLVLDENDNVIFLSKECDSNGCIGTLDVTYPSIPLFLKYNPELVLGMLRPIIRYAQSEAWPYEYTPHDVGQYPLANGQVYGLKKETGELMENYQMPVEEAGNMLLCVAAVRKYGKEIGEKFFEENKAILKQWAEYLTRFGYDPGNQLCTDDFAGHLNHNCNLSLKAILGIYAYGDMAGDDSYCKLAKEYAQKWENDAADKEGTRLAFDVENSWSLKYNIVWDNLLGYNIFTQDVKKKEIELYKTKLNRYGVPLDSRKDYTKIDWLMWSTVIFDDKEYFDAVCDSMIKMMSETGDRVPMTDWYCTKSAVHYSFQNRTVVGGLFINLI